MSRRYSKTLDIRDGEYGERIGCSACGHRLSVPDEPWKPVAKLTERAMNGAQDTPYCEGKRVVLRTFACPGCGALLDTEIALPGDPFINDVIYD